MVKPNLRTRVRFNTPRECIEFQLKRNEIETCYYKFEGPISYYAPFESPDAKKVTPEEMLEIAVEQFDKYGEVLFDGVNKNRTVFTIGCWDEYAFEHKYPEQEVATIKEVNKEKRLYKLLDYCDEELDKNSEDDEVWYLFLSRMHKIREAISDLRGSYNWRDEMFRENGLVGLRNILGEILVPCGEYNYIKGCEYGNDTTLAVAAKDGKFGLIKRDGKGTVEIPFNYSYIEQLTYDKSEVEPDQAYDIFYGEWEDTNKGKDLIVDGQVVIKNADIGTWLKHGGILYQKDGKSGFLGVFWDWCLTDPIFDQIICRNNLPHFLFVKDGIEGFLTKDKEFIPTDNWDHMTEDQQDELMANGIGYDNYND